MYEGFSQKNRKKSVFVAYLKNKRSISCDYTLGQNTSRAQVNTPSKNVTVVRDSLERQQHQKCQHGNKEEKWQVRDIEKFNICGRAM